MKMCKIGNWMNKRWIKCLKTSDINDGFVADQIEDVGKLITEIRGWNKEEPHCAQAKVWLAKIRYWTLFLDPQSKFRVCYCGYIYIASILQSCDINIVCKIYRKINMTQQNLKNISLPK